MTVVGADELQREVAHKGLPEGGGAGREPADAEVHHGSILVNAEEVAATVLEPGVGAAVVHPSGRGREHGASPTSSRQVIAVPVANDNAGVPDSPRNACNVTSKRATPPVEVTRLVLIVNEDPG